MRAFEAQVCSAACTIAILVNRGTTSWKLFLLEEEQEHITELETGWLIAECQCQCKQRNHTLLVSEVLLLFAQLAQS
eukprot:3899842-Rhodomonas_salina.3